MCLFDVVHNCPRRCRCCERLDLVHRCWRILPRGSHCPARRVRLHRVVRGRALCRRFQPPTAATGVQHSVVNSESSPPAGAPRASDSSLAAGCAARLQATRGAQLGGAGNSSAGVEGDPAPQTSPTSPSSSCADTCSSGHSSEGEQGCLWPATGQLGRWLRGAGGR